MTQPEVQALIKREIEEYEYIEAEGTLGKPWPEARIRQLVPQLMDALVSPELVMFECRCTWDELHTEPPIRREYWFVARVTEDVVFFDEDAYEFGLASWNSGKPSTIGVRGDLIGVFGAR